MNGQTSTRPRYVTPRRIRVSTPDGREVLFDANEDRVTLIDHRRKVYWEGPVVRTDSIIDVTDGSRWNRMGRNATADAKPGWARALDCLPDSILVDEILNPREIAGYSCSGRTVRASSFLTLERWTASAVSRSMVPATAWAMPRDFRKVALAI